MAPLEICLIMDIALPDRWLRQAAATAIVGYQKHLSPRKGFVCAHRVLHGGDSCSQYVKRVILAQGLLSAIPATRQRFQACKAAHQVLQARQQNPRPAKPPDQPQSDKCTSWQADCSNLNGLDGCADCAIACTDADCGSLDCSPDWNCNDCGSGADCSGLDCSGADCGSCGS